MKIVTCTHCSSELQVGKETEAALKGKLQFQCPSCSSFLPTILIKNAAKLPDQPSSENPGKSVFSGIDRNMLILGASAIIFLGGLGFFLLTRGDRNDTSVDQNIVQDTTRNQYFSDLIASGDAEEEALGKFSNIIPWGPTFIGITSDPLIWQDAGKLANQAGGAILTVESASDRTAPWSDPSTRRLVNFLENNFPDADGRTVWVSQDSSETPRVIDFPDVSPVTTADRPRYAFVRWFRH